MNDALRAIWLSLLLGGCATTTSFPEAPTPIADAFMAERRYAEAAQAFSEAAAGRTHGGEALLLRAAEAWLAAGEFDSARGMLAQVDAIRLSARNNAERSLLRAQLALHDGDAESALALLAPSGQPLSPERVLQRQRLRAQALEQTGAPFAAALELASIDRLVTTAERSANRRHISELLAGVDSESLRTRGATLPGDDALRPFINRALNIRGLAALQRGSTSADSAIAMSGPIDADGYQPGRRLALLLPLSGPLAGAGRAVLDGVLAAHFQETRDRPQLLLYDTQGSSTGVEDAYGKAEAAGADRVLGPLDRDAVATLFSHQIAGVPLLALNRIAVPPPPGSVSFALAPEDDGVAAAERMIQKGLLRALAIASPDEQSRRAVDAFVQHFSERGGEVLAQTQVPESEPNFGPMLRALFNTAGGRIGKGNDGKDKVLLAGNHDAIFVALKAPQARLLVPQLAAIGFEQRPIFATALIVSGSGDLRLDRELDGIEFPEFPWLLGAIDALPDAEHLARTLPSARGSSARLFGFGADGYRLTAYLAQLQRNPGAWLTGATGILRVDGFGNVLRQPAWAMFSGGRVRAVPETGLESELASPDAQAP